MVHLPERPTLIQLQHYMDAVCNERGWTKDSYAEKFLLFTEEVGELAKAIRRTQGLYQEQAKHAQPSFAESPSQQVRLNLEEEFADVFSYLLDLANYFQIDLEKVFREKEQVNAARTWQ